jgi:hypothetical protein
VSCMAIIAHFPVMTADDRIDESDRHDVPTKP